MTSIEKDYVLGHEDAELARLEHQAGILAPATEAILRMAGLAPGMRVLDLGTGLGDVAFAAAGIVGPAGEVVGIDQSRSVVARATSRAEERGLDNVGFEVGDVGTWHDGSRFDAVVGRLILLYCPDQPAVIRHHAASLVARRRLRGDGVRHARLPQRAAHPARRERPGVVPRCLPPRRHEPHARSAPRRAPAGSGTQHAGRGGHDACRAAARPTVRACWPAS